VRLPKSKLGRFVLFFLSELFSFFVISVNNIALNKGNYLWTVSTDMILVFQGMLISKLMIEDEKSRDWASIFGFTFGGACGSALAIYATHHFWRDYGFN
jgi:hypothetical protein